MEIVETAEVWDFEQEDGTFSHTAVIGKVEDIFYYGKVPFRLQNNRDRNLPTYMTEVPVDEIYPEFPADFHEFKETAGEIFYKTPRLISYGEQKDRQEFANSLLREATVYEILRRNPHPNIAQYLGCKVSNGKLTSIVLVKYPQTLEQRMKNSVEPLNKSRYLEGIRQGLAHLHDLGFVYNDLNPFNVMVDDNDTAVIVDLNSCCPPGEVLVKDGTPGWSDEYTELSCLENDESAFQKLCHYLYEGYSSV
jgi:serine/threonine protein kinase